MSGYYPPGVTGNEDYFTGVWYCVGCEEKQDPATSEEHIHPETDDLYCRDCWERLMEKVQMSHEPNAEE